MNIYPPCELGVAINDDTVLKIQADILAGAANNQLADELNRSEILNHINIVYAPEFLINAAGIIYVYAEL